VDKLARHSGWLPRGEIERDISGLFDAFGQGTELTTEIFCQLTGQWQLSKTMARMNACASGPGRARPATGGPPGANWKCAEKSSLNLGDKTIEHVIS